MADSRYKIPYKTNGKWRLLGPKSKKGPEKIKKVLPIFNRIPVPGIVIHKTINQNRQPEYIDTNVVEYNRHTGKLYPVYASKTKL